MPHIPVLVSRKLAKYAVFYGIASSSLCSVPFFVVSIAGTRSKHWLVCSIVSNAIVFLHFAILWIACLIADGPVKGMEVIVPLGVGATLLCFQIAIAAAISASLQTRLWEEAIALHSAHFWQRRKSDNELVVV